MIPYPTATTPEGAWTPGPWTVDMHDGERLLICDEDNAVIAEVDTRNFEDRDEGLANARLIAASPALYAALKWFIDDIDGTHTVMTDFDAAVATARSALSHATGQSLDGQEME